MKSKIILSLVITTSLVSVAGYLAFIEENERLRQEAHCRNTIELMGFHVSIEGALTLAAPHSDLLKHVNAITLARAVCSQLATQPKSLKLLASVKAAIDEKRLPLQSPQSSALSQSQLSDTELDQIWLEKQNRAQKILGNLEPNPLREPLLKLAHANFGDQLRITMLTALRAHKDGKTFENAAKEIRDQYEADWLRARVLMWIDDSPKDLEHVIQAGNQIGVFELQTLIEDELKKTLSNRMAVLSH